MTINELLDEKIPNWKKVITSVELSKLNDLIFQYNNFLQSKESLEKKLGNKPENSSMKYFMDSLKKRIAELRKLIDEEVKKISSIERTPTETIDETCRKVMRGVAACDEFNRSSLGIEEERKKTK